MRKVLLITLMIISVLAMMLVVGCEEKEIMDMQLGVPEYDDTPIKVETPEPDVEPLPEPVLDVEKEMGYQKDQEEMMNPEPEPEPEPELVDPYCGDGKCNGDENCRTCEKDCGCMHPRVCYKDECVEPKCDADSDCADAEDCTEDKCYFPAHPNAYCGHEKIKRCSNIDGCCPSDCNANNDDDCEPDCGNDACEEGENDDTCPEDCGQTTQGYCGDGNCDPEEDPKICSIDCLA